MTTTGDGGRWNRRRAGCNRKDTVAPDHVVDCNETIGHLKHLTDHSLITHLSNSVTSNVMHFAIYGLTRRTSRVNVIGINVLITDQ